LKSLILSLLPALEDEASDDYERAFRIMNKLEEAFCPSSGDVQDQSDETPGYFWQCLFLAVITSPSRRQGALNYLVQTLPNFGVAKARNGQTAISEASGEQLTKADIVVSPEPGLLVRCFVCGLSDPQLLIQRGYLDMLVAKVPLSSDLLHRRLTRDEVDRLVSAAMHVLLRREMSLNRRLWSWFLGPDPKESTTNANNNDLTADGRATLQISDEQQFEYFSTFGKDALERCILAMFRRSSPRAVDRARPFRICLSLMDRWEIGGSIVPSIFLPAIESAHRYSLLAAAADTAEVLRSATLLFDGVEASLIWGSMLSLLWRSFAEDGDVAKLKLVKWVIQQFNIKDEEMSTVHIPYAAAYMLALLTAGDNAPSSDCKVIAVDITSLLVDRISTGAFAILNGNGVDKSAQTMVDYSPKAVRRSLDSFYEALQQSANSTIPFKDQALSNILLQPATLLLTKALHDKDQSVLGPMVSVVLTLHQKIPMTSTIDHPGIFEAVRDAVDVAAAGNQILPFPILCSVLTLLSTPTTFRQQPSLVTRDQVSMLTPLLCSHIWFYLSPGIPKFHVEAVKALWQLHELVAAGDEVESSLAALVRTSSGYHSSDGNTSRRDSIGRFAVLWDHTIPVPTTTVTSHKGLDRRSSGLTVLADANQVLTRQNVLREPLMIVLDLLDDPDGTCIEMTASWLQHLATLEYVFSTHFDMLEDLRTNLDSLHSMTDDSIARRRRDSARRLDYVMSHIIGVIRHASEWTWQCLTEMVPSDNQSGEARSGLSFIAEYCCQLLCAQQHTDSPLERKTLELLRMVLSAPMTASLIPLDLDSRIMECMLSWTSQASRNFLGSYLDVVTLALKLRTFEPPKITAEGRPSSSNSAKRSSLTIPPPSPIAPTAMTLAIPPLQLTNFIQMGFSSLSLYGNHHQWVHFLTNVLPIFSDAIFTSLLPLVETLCVELGKVHQHMLSLAKPGTNSDVLAPETTAMALLDALEMILARAHECLLNDHSVEAPTKSTVPARGLLGAVTSGVFRAEGPPSKTAQANSRLTVVLAFQDSIRVCWTLWTWATRFSDVEEFDKDSAATTSFNALRVRNRTRRLLEQMFAVEILESLEVVISTWWHSKNSATAAASLNLLHVVPGLRPKNIVPATLDALCSRTNPAALSAERLSCQTTDLTALEIALFLSAYLNSTEDDAMDELWSDCMAFFRDVLANPLPYRQILPALLSTILLLAQKIDNTNFGEQRKMRRELGDIFLRMLGATFTAMPAATLEMRTSNGSEAGPDDRSINLVTVLSKVTANIEVILESSDRISSAISSMWSGLISPVFHAKAFPNNVSPDLLTLLLQMAKKVPTAKPWRKDLLDAFNDPRILMSSSELMEGSWFPVLRQWCAHDKERMPDLLSRLPAPASAGIMFGVGASAARLDADRKAQMTLRRVCLVLMACPEDQYATLIRAIEEKLEELFDASASSSPSSAIKAELFMLCRALLLSMTSIHLAPLWPAMNRAMQSALMSLLPNMPGAQLYNNLSLLQACKLLDTLVALSPDEFQLHEWLYITDTIDAVYQPAGWTPTALSDEVAEALGKDEREEPASPVTPTTFSANISGHRRPLLDDTSLSNREDIKAMARDDFARYGLKPFLGQLSLHAYEGVYAMEPFDKEACRRNLLDDLLDLSTIVE